MDLFLLGLLKGTEELIDIVDPFLVNNKVQAMPTIRRG